MSERYYITGVQLGMLKAVSMSEMNASTCFCLLKEIEDKQFVGRIEEGQHVGLMNDQEDLVIIKGLDFTKGGSITIGSRVFGGNL